MGASGSVRNWSSNEKKQIKKINKLINDQDFKWYSAPGNLTKRLISMMTIQSVVGGSVLTALVVLSGGVRCVGTRRPREDVHVLGGGGALGAPLDGGGRGLWFQFYTKEIKTDSSISA